MKSVRSFSFLVSLFILVGCKSPTEDASQSYNFSFESDLEGWTVRALDVTMSLQDSTIAVPWHIMQTGQRATHGSKSVEFYFNNINDAAKIWIEKSFQLDPDKSYRVTVTYDFASADGGSTGGQALVTRVVSSRPQTPAEIIAGALPEGTYNGSGFAYRWLSKQIQATIQTHSSGQIVVVIGIWGTFEIASTYFVDNVSISIGPI